MELKDFQIATSNRITEVFASGQNRILLADEVGLGKTIIARDVIAQQARVFHEQNPNQTFKVLYICSNINIANQNVTKLGIENTMHTSESRLSMQHLKVFENKLKDNYTAQLIPLTPATSFQLKTGAGTQEERALLFAIVRRLPKAMLYQKELNHFFSVHAKKYWPTSVETCEKKVTNPELEKCGYLAEMEHKVAIKMQEDSKLLEEMISCATNDSDNTKRVKEIINNIRRVFAEISVDMLQPNLVIMDEFQRFKDLIQPSDDEQGMICRKFLQQDKTKVLLLSATPYKPYSTLEDLQHQDQGDHYKEFMEVMNYLFYNPEKNKQFQKIWGNYSRSLTEFKSEHFTLLSTHKKLAEDCLYDGICRTERLNQGVIDDSNAKVIAIDLHDGLSYVSMQQILEEMWKKNQKNYKYRNVPLDYIKSSPYLLSFMDQYQLKQQIINYYKSVNDYTTFSTDKGKYTLINRADIQNYQAIPEYNARLKEVKKTVFEQRAELLLWIPPSRPHYQVEGIFHEHQGYSKTLVFSSWEMVPRMLAIMLSYEAERKTLGELLSQKDKRARGYFASKEDRRYGVARLQGDSETVLTYVCTSLANIYQPDKYHNQTIDAIRNILRDKIQMKITRAKANYKISESSQAGAKALVELMKHWNYPQQIMPPSLIPNNAVDLLIDISIASPAHCLHRILHDYSKASEIARDLFVKLFNKSESAAVLDLLYGEKKEAYYEQVLRYCLEGNIQAMLEEYIHVIDSDKLSTMKELQNTLLDTSVLHMDTKESFIDGEVEKSRMRTHFAVGYFNASTSDDNIQRTESIRKAFNSPFRPFVLATTSIGQEGLDFHSYCRKIVHWNLPSNPIDLEQREGRVNRYKCLAVRQNVAKRYGIANNWDAMFALAKEKESNTTSDLIPYWCVTPEEDSYQIERHVPMYPLSQDQVKYDKLLDVLSLYRLTLGQPRQEELLHSLQKEIDPEQSDIFIDLSPFNKLK